MNDLEVQLTKALTSRVKAVIIPENDIIKIMQKHCDILDLPEGCIVTGVNYDFQRMGWLVKLCNTKFPSLERFAELQIITVKEKEE